MTKPHGSKNKKKVILWRVQGMCYIQNGAWSEEHGKEDCEIAVIRFSSSKSFGLFTIFGHSYY